MIVILNTAAGSVAAGEQQRAEVAHAFRRHGLETVVWRATSGEELGALAARAAESASKTIVAGGGDGTLNAVASAIVGTAKRLGVLPLGTLNHFAKDLGLPLGLDDAALTIATGHEQLVDVGEVNGRIFLNNSSLGLYPRIVRDRERQQQRLGRGKWPAFTWALMSALHVCPRLHLRLQADGCDIACRTPFLFVGNNPYNMDVLKIGQRERLDSGVLGVYFARGAGRFGLVVLALRSLVGRVRQSKCFETLHVSELHVATRRKQVHVAADGEVKRFKSPFLYRSRPRALRVLVSPQNPGG